MEIDKLLSGKTIINIKGERVCISPPSLDIRHYAEIFSQEIYDRAFMEDVPLFEELLEITDWTDQDEKDLTITLQNNLEQMKLDYYKRFYQESSKRLIKMSMNNVIEKIAELSQKKNKYYAFSCEHLRDYAYTSYIVEHCSDKQVNTETAVQLYNQEVPNQDKIREFSKSAYWRTLWGSYTEKSKIFGNPECLTRPQVELISFTRMYDNVYQSMDCPDDEVIEDDIALDGWFIEQRRKREEESGKKGKQVSPNANEVFIPTGNKKDAQRVIDMNSTWGKGVIKSIGKDVKASNEVNDLNLSHVKQTINMESTKQAFRGRK